MKQVFYLVLSVFALGSCDDTAEWFNSFDVVLTGIKITSVAHVNNGIAWDEDSEPDFGFMVKNADGNIIFISDNIIEQSPKQLPLKLTLTGAKLPKIDHKYQIVVFDLDGDSREIMGFVEFNPGEYSEKNIEVFRKSSSNLEATLYLKWGDPGN